MGLRDAQQDGGGDNKDMTDTMTPEQRHRCMSHIRSKGTKPELKDGGSRPEFNSGQKTKGAGATEFNSGQRTKEAGKRTQFEGKRRRVRDSRIKFSGNGQRDGQRG